MNDTRAKGLDLRCGDSLTIRERTLGVQENNTEVPTGPFRYIERTSSASAVRSARRIQDLITELQTKYTISDNMHYLHIISSTTGRLALNIKMTIDCDKTAKDTAYPYIKVLKTNSGPVQPDMMKGFKND